MLMVKTFLAPSQIHGLGLYASEDIKSGNPVGYLNWSVDRFIRDPDFEVLPDIEKDFIRTYAIHDNGGWICLGDNGRFINHSRTPNVETGEDGVDYSTRDIAKGEEITFDYRVFVDDEVINEPWI